MVRYADEIIQIRGLLPAARNYKGKLLFWHSRISYSPLRVVVGIE